MRKKNKTRQTASGQRWSAYQPSEAAPWDLRRVVHLHRRTGFAGTWAEIQRDLHDGPQAAVDRLLDGKACSTGVPDDFDFLSRVIGDAAVASDNPARLKAWWVYRMLFAPDPLSERLALVWHNHFATSNRKVDSLGLMRTQNEIFRRLARAPFGQLLRQIVKHPALLIWLDADANRKEHPNENLARELMELFTLGVGNYGERDVKEAARALTGWTVTRGRFRFVREQHDDGIKTILGHTGRLDGDDLVKILLEHPATARQLAWRLCHELMGDGVVGADDLDALADGLRQRKLDVGWAIETILRSELFFQRRTSAAASGRPPSLSWARFGHWSCLIRRPARSFWPNGSPGWDRICSIRPTSSAGTAGGPGSRPAR